MAAPDEPDQSPDALRYSDVLRDRDRIAAGLRHDVIRRIFSIGLSLESTATIVTDALVRRRVEQAVDDLDEVVRVIRDVVFGLADRRGQQCAAEGRRADLHDGRA
jgi:hypothetical protein